MPDASYSVTIKSPDYEAQPVPISVTMLEDRHVLEVPIEYRHTLFNGVITILVSVEDDDVTHEYSEFVEVVTPLFTAVDLADVYPTDKVPELESLVRKVIEARTGQVFGKVKQSVVADDSTNVVNFDVPLIEFTGVSNRYLTHTTTLTPPKESYEIATDRFSMAVNWDYYHTKTDSMWILSKRNYGCHVIHGTFGYERVPQDVKQAALLIAGVWGCEQAVWRDRFIETMRSSDWSVGYNEGAFTSTGSATADQLLAKYTRKYIPEVF